MTYAMRPMPTRTLICDLCGEPIDEGGENGSRGNLLTHVSPINQVTDKTRHALIAWPNFRKKPQFPEGVPMRSYDFHGTCIATLVHEATTSRKALSEANHA